MKRILVVLLCLCLMQTAFVAAVAEEPVVIRYAAWNVGDAEDEENMERRMIKEYAAAHPNVVIEVVEDIDFDDGYMDALRNLAAVGELPDIMMFSILPDMLAGAYLMDISAIAQADPEWANIPAGVEKAMRFDGGVYGIPAALYAYGFFVNDDLFEGANLDPLEPDFTLEEMVEAVKTLTNPTTGVLGLNEVYYFPDWIPYYLNRDFQHTTWDGEKFNLGSPEFAEGIALCAELVSGGYTFDSLDEDGMAAYNTDWAGDVWYNGQLAVSFDCTWSLPDYQDVGDAFVSRFIGMPGNANILIPDFFGISATCAHPEAAYDFAKYMSFGSEGFNRRIALRDEEGLFMETLPISTEQAILDAFFAGCFPGLENCFNDIDNAILEGEAVIPAYADAVYNTQTGLSVEVNGETIENATVRDIISSCIYGGNNIADYASRLNEIANENVASTLAAMKEHYSK